MHLTYETDFDGCRARRSSLWRKQSEETGWRMYYHQGTPVPPDAGQRPARSYGSYIRTASASPRRSSRDRDRSRDCDRPDRP